MKKYQNENVKKKLYIKFNRTYTDTQHARYAHEPHGHTQNKNAQKTTELMHLIRTVSFLSLSYLFALCLSLDSLPVRVYISCRLSRNWPFFFSFFSWYYQLIFHYYYFGFRLFTSTDWMCRKYHSVCVEFGNYRKRELFFLSSYSVIVCMWSFCCCGCCCWRWCCCCCRCCCCCCIKCIRLIEWYDAL